MKLIFNFYMVTIHLFAQQAFERFSRVKRDFGIHNYFPSLDNTNKYIKYLNNDQLTIKPYTTPYKSSETKSSTKTVDNLCTERSMKLFTWPTHNNHLKKIALWRFVRVSSTCYHHYSNEKTCTRRMKNCDFSTWIRSRYKISKSLHEND